MSKYDFTTVVDRTAQSSAKWLAMRETNPAVPPGIPPFSVADLDLPLALEIRDGLRSFLEHGIPGYTRAPQAFIDATLGWMQRRHRWTVDPEWLVQSPGVVPAIFTAVRAFTAPGDSVIVQTPAYYPFYSAIESNGRRVLRNPLVIEGGRYTFDFDGLAKLAAEPATKLLLLCSPHNPTGRVWTEAELRRIAEIALANDLLVVSDEIHFDLVMPGHHHTVFTTLGDDIAQHALVCTAPSKSFNLAGLQTSNIVIPNPALRERFTAARDATGFFFLTTLGYAACTLAYNRAEAWLDELLLLIESNRKRVRDFMATQLPRVKVFELEGTYLQWLDFRGLGLTAAQLQATNEHDALVFFDEGTVFGPEGAGFERMHLATPTAALEAALERLARCYGDAAGHR